MHVCPTLIHNFSASYAECSRSRGIVSETWAASATLRAGINRIVDTRHAREVKWRSLHITAGRQFEEMAGLMLQRWEEYLATVIGAEGSGMSIKGHMNAGRRDSVCTDSSSLSFRRRLV